MLLTTQNLKENEAKILAPYAVLSKNSRGRKHPEQEDPTRLPFQKDRDRILHCRAFRRLKGKTQVFVPHHGDHYRNRLTHSLEVAQVSRDMARTLGLNEDLAESISLAHDLGHTPFGHAGEDTLHECLKPHGLTFEHNEQSRRIVEDLENIYPNFPGLNLSIEVIEGLMKHGKNMNHTLEAQVVNLGDEIAYQNHDVDDGLRSGLFTEEDLDALELWSLAKAATEAEYGPILDQKVRISRTVSKMISLMIQDICAASHQNLLQGKKQIAFSSGFQKANKELKDFLLTRLYLHPEVRKHTEAGQATLRALFKHHSQAMEPSDLRDYLAGMTDQFALELAAELHLPVSP